jgi:transcriptional regulator with XRE-family HTH domain
MDHRARITLRTKKLGLLIRAAREAQRRSLDDCAHAMGIGPNILALYEEGEYAPSLPEIELLAYYLQLPIAGFWANETADEAASPADTLPLEQLRSLRHRVIGALLRQEREQANLTAAQLAGLVGITVERLNAFELGEEPIPVPELEAMLSELKGRVEDLFDRKGPVGKWMADQTAVQKFLELPGSMQSFITLPVNRPYLELAIKLSEMSKERLRSVAEGLLDITL